MSLSPADMKLPLTPTITEPLVVEQPENHRWPLVKKIAWMSLSLVAGIAFAVGHHSFYHGLDGTPPPSTSYAVWGFPHGYSKQQLNISIGNTLAFLAKAFLAVAIATAHDQINWRAIKRSPTELGLIDALFSAREAIPNALNARMWWHMPVPAILLLLFWLLPLAPLIAPSTLNIQTVMLNTTTSMRTPRVDFTSMNFASIFWTFNDITRALNDKEWQTFEMTYRKPQFPVQKSVQGSLYSGSILPIAAPGPNSTWSMNFHGPALSCNALDNTHGLGNDTISQLASELDDVRYLSWVPAPSNGSSIPGSISSDLHSITVGGTPLALYVMIPPAISYSTIQTAPIPPGGSGGRTSPANYSSEYNASVLAYETARTNYYLAYTYLQECTLQNVSYSADFAYTNGLQNITLSTSSPMNNVSYLEGFSSFAEISANASGFFPYDPNFTTVKLNQSDVEMLAYQSVMDAFSAMFVGYVETITSTIDEKSSIQYTVDTSMGTTSLTQGKEMSNVTQSLALQYGLLGNVQWEGKSVNQNETGTKPLTELMEEMFRNATVSLMSNSALNPNYDSPFAPSNVTVEGWTSQNLYRYESATLWVTYGIAIGISALSVLLGALVVISQGAAYSTSFSTLLRTAHNLYLPVRIAPQDTGGKNPLPEYLGKAVVRFPPEGTALLSETEKN